MKRTAVLALAAVGCAPPVTADDPLPDCRPRRSECPAPVSEEFRDPVRHIGRASGSTFIETLDVIGDFPIVYACTGVRALSIWNAEGDKPSLITEDVAPTGLSDPSFPRCQHLGWDKPNARMAITNRGDEIQPEPWLAVFDLSDPGSPKSVATWAPGGVSVEGVVLDGDTAYVAGHTAGLIKLQLSGDTFTELGRFSDGESDAWLPAKLGDTLVVAEGATGLRTYDVAADTPQLLGAIELGGSSRDLVIRDGIAYVAASNSIAAVDISDPAAPALLGRIDTAGTALTIALGPGSTVVTAEWDAVRGYDVSDPAAITLAFSEVVPTDDEFSRVLAAHVDVDAGKMVAGEWTGVHQFEIEESGRGPDIGVSPQSVQFGEIAAGDEDDAVIVVRNHGDLPLTVTDVVSLGGVSVDQDCFAVPAGGAQAIEVSVSPESSAELTTGIKFCSDDPDEPEHEVTLSANVSGLDVGDPAPEFSLVDTTGATWTSEQLRGRVTVLAYFATF